MSVCHGCIAPKRHVGCRTTCPAWDEEQLAKKLRYEVREIRAAGERDYLHDKTWRRRATERPMALKHT